MDNLSNELHLFLVNLGRNPHCVSERVEHYMKHILHLLTVPDESLLIRYYGLFGSERIPAEELARQSGMSPEELESAIAQSLRKLAITPEWQMVRQFTGGTSSPA